jgi:hypothetical protein
MHDNASKLHKVISSKKKWIPRKYRKVISRSSTFKFKKYEKAIEKCTTNEVRLVILESTHGDCEKYKYSVFGSTTFT